jgi:hypothetical protein
MRRRVAFVALSFLALTFLILGYRREANFLSDLWSQLFLLTIGTLSTTFILDTILRQDADKRARAKDAFAFRSFSAQMLSALHEMVGFTQPIDGLLEAAISGNDQFAAEARRFAAQTEKSADFDPKAYLKRYLDIQNGLRGLSRGYIRLFSANPKDMLTQDTQLNELAADWRYYDEFSDSSRAYTATLKPDDPQKPLREAAFDVQVSFARELVKKTIKMIEILADKNARGRGFYD